MKKAILFAAALFVAVASFAQNEYNYQKRSLFEQLPIRGNDIVFLGNSITDGCEWAELGISTPGATRKVRPRKRAVPCTYCMGSKLHRRKRMLSNSFSSFGDKIISLPR